MEKQIIFVYTELSTNFIADTKKQSITFIDCDRGSTVNPAFLDLHMVAAQRFELRTLRV